MARKDALAAKKRTNSRRTWKTRLSLAFGTAIILGACVAIRYYWGPDGASAGVPTPPTPARSKTTHPPANPAAARITSSPTGAAALRTAPAMKTVAVVNAEEISRQDLARETLRRFGKEVLESLVNKHLILQACGKQGILVTQQDVEAEIEQMAGKWGLSKDRFLAMLRKERHIDPDQYRRDIIWPTLALRRLAAGELTVTADEMKEAWESAYGPKVQVRMISVTRREEAESLRKQAVAHPEQFGALAKDHSADVASAAARGLIPPIRMHLGEPEVERVAFGLKEGEISPILYVARQYVILKCEKHLPPTSISEQFVEDAKKRLRDRLRDQKMRGAATDIFKRLQARAKLVNVYNNPEMRSRMPGIAATINDGRITIRRLSEECIARHGIEVLAGEINRKLLTQALRKRKLTVTEGDLDAEIARAAEMYGYVRDDGAPDVDAWLARITKETGGTVELYVRDSVWPSAALKKIVGDRVRITDEDLKKAYEANYGERVEAMVIVLDDHHQALKVWSMARNHPTDKFFGELAAQYSIEPVSKANKGRVPPIRRYSGQPHIEEKAFSLQPGDLSGVIVVGDKYVILRCVGRKKPSAPAFDEVRKELYADIHEKKLRIAMTEKFDELKESSRIENFLAGTSHSPEPRGTERTVRPASATDRSATASSVKTVPFVAPRK